MSSLAGQQLLRQGEPTTVPVEVIDLWWETGLAGGSVFYTEYPAHSVEIAVRWLCLSYSFSSARHSDGAAYMGDFLAVAGLPHLAAFVALRRLVAKDGVLFALPYQPVWDAYLAVSDAPGDLKADILDFAYDYLLDWTAKGGNVPADAQGLTGMLIRNCYDIVSHEPPDRVTPQQLEHFAAVRDELLSRLVEPG